MTEPQELPQETKDDAQLEKVVGNMSKVNPDVLEKEAAKPLEAALPPSPAPKPPKAVEGARDRQGREFDPALHEVDEKGQPRLNRDGFLAGKPGRPGKFKKEHEKRAGQAPADPQAAPAQPGQPDLAEIQRRNTARISAAVFIRFGVGFFGDEWLPMKRDGLDEQEDLTNSFDEYYKSKGVSDLPPGWALALGLLGYAAVRLHLPKTQTRMQIVFLSLKQWLGNFFSGVFKVFKKFKGVKINGTHDHPGDHGNRKDNAGAEDRGAVQGAGNPGPGA
jgi:hypothetical protein